MKEIKIRIFKKADLSLLQRVIYKTIDVCYSDYYPKNALEYFKSYHNKKNILERNKKGKILIIGTNKKIIGTGAIVGNEITGVFILPEYQKRGFGKDIMNELEDIGRRNKLKKVELSISLPSKIFYNKRGYKITGNYSIDVGENQELKYWKAYKTLQANPNNAFKLTGGAMVSGRKSHLKCCCRSKRFLPAA